MFIDFEQIFFLLCYFTSLTPQFKNAKVLILSLRVVKPLSFPILKCLRSNSEKKIIFPPCIATVM